MKLNECYNLDWVRVFKLTGTLMAGVEMMS